MARQRKNRSLLEDPRYAEFVERYHADPLRFAVEVTGFIPSNDQESLFEAITPESAKVSVVSGTGCFARGTAMMKANGEPVAVEDIAVGDRLMGPDGNRVRNVLALKRGREPMYRFTYIDGSSHIFNESHILCLEGGPKYKRKRINITVREWLKWPKTRRERHYIYRSAVERFERPSENLPVPPYVLGIWLGDGASHKPEISCPDEEVLAAWEEYARSLGCSISRALNSRSKDGVPCWNSYAGRICGQRQENPITGALREIGVFGNKHVPDAYRFADIDTRREIIAGLIDTDGHYSANSSGYELTQKNERLARQICWLVRSIGCHATVRQVSKSCQTGAVGSYWRITIGRGVDNIPVRVPRKKRPVELAQQRPRLIFSIANVEPLGEGDYYGFVLDGDSRFLGYDFTVLHNTGKTAAFARIALWHLLCFPVAVYDGKVELGSNTYIGAPFIQQVADGIWKEMQDTRIAIANGPHAWINDFFTITKTRVHVNGYAEQWFITQIAMKKGEAIGVAGKHRYWQLIIIDEAAGVPDEHFNVIDGTQTQGGNRTLMASQGARSAGRFYDSHHSLSHDNGGSWKTLRFNSEASPFVTTQWLHERADESGGRNSVEYQIRVLGLFAQDSSNVLMTRADIEAAFDARKLIDDDEPYGLLVLSDVALGEYRDDSVAIVAKVIGNADQGADARRVEVIDIPIASNDKNEIDLAGDLVNLVGKLSNATLYVDAGGVGATVCKLIERSGATVTRVNWGAPCFKNEYKSRFYNLRACAMVRFRDAIRQGRVKLPQGLPKRLREKIIDQGSRLPYHFSEAGGLRYVMARKDDMRRDGIKSPDLIDAMSFAFLENASYMVADGASATSTNLTASVLEKAKDLFADV